ncbi:Solute carrier family 41 member 2 [Dissostichus eleginoides]|uniref:Solute carrier family 41 member 2 n=1 Tax=Dissostichus eleginoides TaxID=100907 RepID=A0AAD9ET90_DISEL|nr:Solute carrier family 41 member 2 [Dissostichus eleginoides]
MDRGDGFREETVDTSPSVSSGSSWTSFDRSTDLTSVSSDQLLTPLTAPVGCKLFEDQRLKMSSSSVKVSSEVTWTETSFLGNDE